MKNRQLNTPPDLAIAPDLRLAPGMPPGSRVKALAIATTVALLCLPGARDAQAQSIGALEVRSRLGDRFFGAVPVKVDGGVLDPRCIRVVSNPNAPDGADPLQNARVRIGSADSVIIETPGAVTSPILGLRVEVGCSNTVSRDFVVLSDMPGEAAPPAPAIAPVAAAPVVPPAAKRPVAPARAATPRQVRPANIPAPALPTIDSPASSVAAATAAMPRAVAAPPTAGAIAGAVPPQLQNAQRLAELQARSDDQAAALLALEDRLTLLQKQAELLKLQLEQALAGAAPGPAAVATAAPASSVATAAAGTSESERPVVQPAPTAPSPTPQISAAATPQVVQASPRKEPGVLDLLLDWRVGGGIAALVLGAFALRLRRRPVLATDQRKARMAADAPPRSMTPLDMQYDPSVFDKTGEYPVASAFAAQASNEWPNAQQPAAAQSTAEWVPPSQPPTTDNFPVPTPAMASTLKMPAATPATMSREFHISQQFQPNAERVVALSAPDEIVQQARTHYMDDGDPFRAIDLLEMAVSVRKDSPRPWQALFAIYRREIMPERFQRLAIAYRSTFGEDENWPAVQALGRAMEADNKIYAGPDPVQPLPEDLLERWLGVPLDFTAHLLANEMHDQLMSTYPGRRRRRSSAQ